MENDIANAEVSIENAHAHVAKLQKDVDKLLGKVSEVEVCRSVGAVCSLLSTNDVSRPSTPVQRLSSPLNVQR